MRLQRASNEPPAEIKLLAESCVVLAHPIRPEHVLVQPKIHFLIEELLVNPNKSCTLFLLRLHMKVSPWCTRETISKQLTVVEKADASGWNWRTKEATCLPSRCLCVSIKAAFISSLQSTAASSILSRPLQLCPGWKRSSENTADISSGYRLLSYP